MCPIFTMMHDSCVVVTWKEPPCHVLFHEHKITIDTLILLNPVHYSMPLLFDYCFEVIHEYIVWLLAGIWPPYVLFLSVQDIT